jgi:hypothetical protein
MAKSKNLKKGSSQFESYVIAMGIMICIGGIIVTCWSALTTEALVPWGLF